MTMARGSLKLHAQGCGLSRSSVSRSSLSLIQAVRNAGIELAIGTASQQAPPVGLATGSNKALHSRIARFRVKVPGGLVSRLAGSRSALPMVSASVMIGIRSADQRDRTAHHDWEALAQDF